MNNLFVFNNHNLSKDSSVFGGSILYSNGLSTSTYFLYSIIYFCNSTFFSYLTTTVPVGVGVV